MRQQRKKWAYSELRKIRPGLGYRVIYKDFYERGRYVAAHNRDVRYSPTHSELLSDVDCTETLPRYQATASQGTSVASSGDSSYTCMIMMTKLLV